MKILQVKITTEGKPITPPDVGITDNQEDYRKQSRRLFRSTGKEV